MNGSAPQHKRVYWNRKMITLFIQLYRENECLYDIKNDNYNNRSKKSEALHGILKEMQNFLPQLCLDDIRTRIKAIRTQLAHELTLIETAEEAGITYESKLWFFQQLSFLRKHMSRLPTGRRDNASDNEASYDDDSDSDDGGKSLFQELAVSKNVLSRENVTGKRPIRRRHIQIKWTHDITGRFIQLFKKQPSLYDVDNEDYADREKRSEARQRLLEDMQHFVPSITMQQVMAKVKSLRTQYTRELRLIASAEENKTTYEPKLWCFNQLSYLKTLYSYDGPSEIGEYVNNSNNEMEDNKDDVVSDVSDDMDTNEDSHTENDDEIACGESVVKSENNPIIEKPNRIVAPDSIQQQQPMKIRLHGVNKESNPKISLKTEDSSQQYITGGKAIAHTYDWLPKLVEAQLEEIAPCHRQEFAWDVQSLVRQYILKTKREIGCNESKLASQDSKKSDQTKEIVLPRSSNVSLNISFI